MSICCKPSGSNCCTAVMIRGTKASSNLKGVICCCEGEIKGHLKALERRLLEGPSKWRLLRAICPNIALRLLPPSLSLPLLLLPQGRHLPIPST